MSDNRKRRIAIGSMNYGYRRVAYGLPVPDITFERRAYVPWKFLRPWSQTLQNTYLFADVRRSELIHLWNGICANRRPWITSFEAHLPRYFVPRADWWYRWAIERLHSPHCRRLMALSEAARQFFFWQNDGLLSEEVRAKTRVFYGGVESNPELQEEHRKFLANRNDELVLCFIGHAFFGKGGWALLDSLDECARRGEKVRLKVISRLLADDHASGEHDERRTKAVARIRANERIEWYESLEHDEVMKHLARSHVGVLPSLDETLGWSILEAMSAGLPVIATNVFAVPEMVEHMQNGFLIPLPLAPNRRWIGIGEKKDTEEFLEIRKTAYELISKGIVECVSMLQADRDLLHRLGQSALKTVRERFDPITQGRTLRAIYDDALREQP